jgi:tetratricopeptide (TPR) repeat protein
MRYIPNLIPEKSKVLNDYFKGSMHSTKSSNSFRFFLGWFVGLIFLLFALVSLIHPMLSILSGFIGFMLIPPGHNWIEKKFKFRLTTKIKSIFVSGLFLFSVPLLSHYDTIDKQEAHQLKLKTDQEEKARAEMQKEEQIRNDSLTFYINASSDLANQHKTDEALKKIENAVSFAKLSTDKERVSVEKNKILTIKTLDLVTSKKYKLALPELDELISKEGSNSNLFYNRAICYSKTGKIKEAVEDCKTAIELGNENADKLYNKINPIKKRVAYYVTRCCDGSTSSATGRGACSHHGGVCDWNDPVYEEYRKYE